MNLVPYILLIVVCFILIHSLSSYVRFKVEQIQHNKINRSISIEVFYTLIIIYLTAIVGFGLIYFILSFESAVLIDLTMQEKTVFERLYQSIYFSGVTMMTIGYGDVSPINIGRIIAVIQALIGYILPTAFVLKIVQSNKGSYENYQESRDWNDK